VNLAEIFRRAGPAYRQAFGDGVLPSHSRAMDDIAACRTAQMGGSLYECDSCGTLEFAYHSCRNRHCPTCHGDRTRRWLARLRQLLLPCRYYLLTFTLPEQLRRVARSNQRLAYDILLRAAASSVQTLVADRQWVGGRVGIVAVLHTWTRAMVYHPHVHLLVTAGGLTADRQAWIKPANPKFLVPGYALSVIFRAKVRDAFAAAGLADGADQTVWNQRWVVHVKDAGTGERVAEYLARYVYRVALTNGRIERFQSDTVTFRYSDSRTHQVRRCTLPSERFIARFLQHVLPSGFTKVRYYGIFAPACREQLDLARMLLARVGESERRTGTRQAATCPHDLDRPRPCAVCGRGQLRLVAIVYRPRGPP
jgi:hypothetical protein